MQSVFVYVREAHPGEHYGHHESFEQKMGLAHEFQRLFDVKRPISWSTTLSGPLTTPLAACRT